MYCIKSLVSLLFAASLLILPITQSYAGSIKLDSCTEGGRGVFSGELLESSCASVGVVIFHGRGASPTGPVVEELRTSLHRAGYTTLSIENPKPLNGMTDFQSYVDDVNGDNFVFPEAYARMRTAINYFQSLGVQQIVVAGFSMGSRLATAHVARGQKNELQILGLIGIGMYGTSIEPLNISSTLDEVSVPVYDLYGDVDTNAVNTAVARAIAYASGVGTSHIQETLTCLGGATNCHQLEGLKGGDTMPFEVSVNAWMQANAPAGLQAACTPPTAPVAPAKCVPPVSDSGGSLSIQFILACLLLSLLRRFNSGVLKNRSL